MGMLLDALSGAGKGLSEVATQQLDQLNKAALVKQMADADVNKAGRIAENQYQLSNRVAERAGQYVSSALNTPVPDKAPAPTVASGNIDATDNTNADGSPRVGFKENYVTAMADVARIKDPTDKAAALAQLNQQFGVDSATAQAGVTTTHTPTPAEAIPLAMNQALQAGDMTAYAALKGMNADQYINIPDRGALLDRVTGKIVFTNTAGDDRAENVAQIRANATENAATTRANAMITAWASRGDAQDARNQQREAQQNARTDLSVATRQLDAYTNISPFTTKPAEKAALQRNIDNAMADIADARGRLKAFGGSSTPDTPPAASRGMIAPPASPSTGLTDADLLSKYLHK